MIFKYETREGSRPRGCVSYQKNYAIYWFGSFQWWEFQIWYQFCCIYRKNPPKSAAAAFWRHQIHWIIEAYIYFFTYHDYGLLNYFLPFKKDKFLHNTLILGYFTLRTELKSHHWNSISHQFFFLGVFSTYKATFWAKKKLGLNWTLLGFLKF